MRSLILGILAGLAIGTAHAESAAVKYCGAVDLASFKCDTTTSSFIKRACYDAPNKLLIMQLNKTNYIWCGVDEKTYGDLMGAPSKGKFFNQNIRGKFGCKDKMPSICKSQ